MSKGIFSETDYDEDLPIEKTSKPAYLKGGGRYEGGRFIFKLFLDEVIKKHFRKFDNENYISFIISDSFNDSKFEYSHSVFINQKSQWPEHHIQSDTFLTICDVTKYNYLFTISEKQLRSICYAPRGYGKPYFKFEMVKLGIFKFEAVETTEVINWLNGVSDKPNKTNSIF
jgi:hypothetical protein